MTDHGWNMISFFYEYLDLNFKAPGKDTKVWVIIGMFLWGLQMYQMNGAAISFIEKTSKFLSVQKLCKISINKVTIFLSRATPSTSEGSIEKNVTILENSLNSDIKIKTHFNGLNFFHTTLLPEYRTHIVDYVKWIV